MAPLLVRAIWMPWALLISTLSGLWAKAVRLGTAARNIGASETGRTAINASHINQGKTTTAWIFPAATEDQINQSKKEFILSLDPEAVCALASRFNNGKPCQIVRKDNGSFNVCFVVEFERDGPKWVVRIPLVPVLDNPWEKIISEVATVRYLAQNTKIPVPNVRAFGRDAKLTKTGIETQVFLITEFITGEPLNKKDLITAGPGCRKAFHSQLIDILAELRQLEFSTIGSLMPNPGDSLHPVLGPVMSMSAATLRLSHRRRFSSAKEYMEYQFSLASEFFLVPVPDHTVEDIKEEVFALHNMERVFRQVIDPLLDQGPFVLHHLDLRSPNIIVDKDLQIQGIIDWEFSGTIPRQMFTPPSWITGHDSIDTNKQMHTEFREVLEEKSKTDGLCNQLRREWYGRVIAGTPEMDPTDMEFCVAHVLRRPTDITDVFRDFFADRLYDEPLDDVISEFFNNHQALAVEAQQRLEHCEHYAEYLKKNGLYETELDKLFAASKALKAKWGPS